MRRGPLLMFGATAAFTVMVAAVKVAREELGPLEIILWRSAVSVPIALVLALRVGLRFHNPKVLGFRVLFGFAAMLGFFTAAKGLALGDLAIIGRTQPILVALMAPLWLGKGERSTKLLWVLLIAGMGGCALIVGPELRVGSTFGLWALGAACCSAMAHLAVRRLGATDHPYVIVFALQASVGVLALFALLAIDGALPAWPPAHLIGPLALTGLMAIAGQLCLTQAYKIEKASTVAAASYAAPVFGMAADLVLWGALPSVWAIAGGVLVVGAGLVLVFGPPTNVADPDDAGDAQEPT